MNFCVICLHYVANVDPISCAHPSCVNRVTGAAEPALAWRMREADGPCGPEGCLFAADTSRFESTAPKGN